MSRHCAPLPLSAEARSELERLIRSHSTPQQLALRAWMIVLAADGAGVGETAQRLGVWRKGVSLWRARWLARHAGEAVAARLQDAPRSGAPATITAEQTCAIVALACERPDDGAVPISHWSTSDLAREAVRRGIITSISPRSVGRFLKRIRPQAASGSPLVDGQARSGL
ncbi:helix-turn-helix domain-containing protein [Mesorhizobium kowhaii]|uniref:helix-turn-helix domain-containing protein n=1 Tax=Mesorhizobium kowhaii TaxID=1300272 RepID=UPI0035ED40DA